jgi:hypothetical protein
MVELLPKEDFIITCREVIKGAKKQNIFVKGSTSGLSFKLEVTTEQLTDILLGDVMTKRLSPKIEGKEKKKLRNRKKKEGNSPDLDEVETPVKTTSKKKTARSAAQTETTDDVIRQRLTTEEKALLLEFETVQVTNKHHDGKKQSEEVRQLLLQGKALEVKEIIRKERETKDFVANKDRVAFTPVGTA